MYLSIFKVKEKKNEKAPDYTASTKIGDKFVTVGGGWIKDSKGGKYISLKLDGEFTHTPYQKKQTTNMF